MLSLDRKAEILKNKAFPTVSQALDRGRGYKVLNLDMTYELLEGGKNGTSL